MAYGKKFVATHTHFCIKYCITKYLMLLSSSEIAISKIDRSRFIKFACRKRGTVRTNVIVVWPESMSAF